MSAQTNPLLTDIERPKMQSKTINSAVLPALLTLATMLSVPVKLDAQNSNASASKSVTEVKLASEIAWQALNPARGAASPQAGTVWGDQTQEGESGFLVKFVDGFSSPPHIHNITYRGIVIDGGLHNDDPDAATMWMKSGSYWTQPAGEVHITAARGASVGYVEIQAGPYLVKPSADAFDNGEKPVNVDSSNIVWLNASSTNWIQQEIKADSDNVELTFLWGQLEDNQIHGSMVKLPAGFSGKLNSESSTFKVVVIQGQTKLQLDAKDDPKLLTAGSYVGSQGKVSHHLSCERECIIYVRTRGQYSMVAE